MTPTHLSLEVHLTTEHIWKYVPVPVDVPAGTGRIDVAYTYGDAISADPLLSGGNTIDIGIFDPRGVRFMETGFRGWSGSARSSFFVAHDDATPGYMPGTIQAGKWNVILGAYKVADAGCTVQVDVTLTPVEESGFPVGFPPLLKLTDKPAAKPHADGWYRGDIHCHTVNSDGDSTVEELVRHAESLGLDFLAITDHNNQSQQIDMARVETDLMLIPGVEVTTYYGHWNTWGDNGWIDFRLGSADDLRRAISEATQRGFLVACNHPRPFGPDWAFPEVEGYACVEVWNGPWELLNTTCLAFWEERLKRGERLTAVGGSDHHFLKREHIAKLGHPTMAIHCPENPSPRALIDALRAGHAYVTASPTGAHLVLKSGDTMMGGSVARPADGKLTLDIDLRVCEDMLLQVCGSLGLIDQVAVGAGTTSKRIWVNVPTSPYVRVQLIDPASEKMRALTNPIYLDDGL